MKFQHFSTFALAAALSCTTLAAHAKPVQITDVNGRKVTVDLPAKRVVLGFYYQDYMAIGGKDALNNVVGAQSDQTALEKPTTLFSASLPPMAM